MGKKKRRITLSEEFARDLVKRLDQHFRELEAIEFANMPNGQHTVGEHLLRTVFGMLISHQLTSVREIRRLALSMLEAVRL